MYEILNYLEESIGIIPFLTGIIFMITAVILFLFPPKKINSFYGYRTPSSMKNQARWDFSQRYSAVKMFQSGLFLIALSFLNTLVSLSQKQATVLGISLLVAVCFNLFLSTEKAIKKNFPNF
jgi:uncharacterized membrane protein